MKKIILLLMLFVIGSNCLKASFPVNKNNVAKADAKVKSLVKLQSLNKLTKPNFEISTSDALSPAAAGESDDMIITLLLWFFLGGLAAHRWYKGKPVLWNILFILTLGGIGIWWIIDGVSIITDKF